jgi:hypothetical protein
LGRPLTSGLPTPDFLQELIDAAGFGLRPLTARITAASLTLIGSPFRFLCAAKYAGQYRDDDSNQGNKPPALHNPSSLCGPGTNIGLPAQDERELLVQTKQKATLPNRTTLGNLAS